MTIATNTEEYIVALLESTNREGMDQMIGYLKMEGFFTAPASTRFHGSYEGGLAKHSLDVYKKVVELIAVLKIDTKSGFGMMPIKVKHENIIIAGCLHDVCKIGAYQVTKKGDGWANNSKKDKGHAKLSITRIKENIKLEKIEEMMIRFHMGIYGLIEFQDNPENVNGEYNLRGDHSMDGSMTKEESSKMRYGKSMSNAYFHNPICKIMSIADELATLEEKAKDAS